MIESLAHKYGIFFKQGQKLRVDAGEPAVAQFQSNRIPKELWPLVPYAEFWGIADDSYRIKLIKQSPADVWKDFRIAVSQYEKVLLDWLAGPEANATPTPEYIAFSAMLQAFDWPRE